MKTTAKNFAVLLFATSFLLLFTADKINAQVPSATPPQVLPEIISEDRDANTTNDDEDNSTSENTSTVERKSSNPRISKENVEALRIKNEEEQKILLLSLDILTKTEERSENLRKKLIEMIEKESDVKNKLEAISFNLKPENIERSTAIYGSLRPEEIREQTKVNLESEKRNLEALLTQVQANRRSLEESVRKADLWVDKVREKFEKQIDKALDIKVEDQNYQQ